MAAFYYLCLYRTKKNTAMKEEERPFIPDESQQLVIDAQGAHHLVLAPPGCGKTGLLAERLCRAHEQGVAFGDMLCLTFTNRASRAMVERINRRLGDDKAEDLFVGNVHRYCARFLYDEGVVSADTSIIDDDESASIIADLMGADDDQVQGNLWKRRAYHTINHFSHLVYQLEHGYPLPTLLHPDTLTNDDRQALHYLCDKQHFTFNVQTLIKIYHNAEDYLDDAQSADTPPQMSRILHGLLSKMHYASLYEKYKRTSDLMDFEDLLILTYNTLHTHPEMRRYRWIQVDEVQDLNGLQMAIIDELTAEDASTVMYLGDEQQAIFSFMGAKIDMLTELKLRCKPNIHHLHQNHRSPGYLLQVLNTYAADVLHIDRDLLPTTTDSTTATRGDLYISYSNTFDDEVRKTAEFAQRLLKAHPDQTTAVIVSSNADANLISEEMEAIGLSHFKVSGSDLFASDDMKILLAHLGIACGNESFINWVRILHGLRIFSTSSLARRFVSKLRRLALSPIDFLLHNNSSYVLEFMRAYEDEEMVVFDTETTGLDTFNDDVIEISAMKIRRGEVVGEPLDLYIATEREIPAMLGKKENPMRAIYDAHAAAGTLLKPAEALRRFMDYVGDDALLGHNVTFDYHILDANMQRYLKGERMSRLKGACFDSLRLIRLLKPGLKKYKLESLLEEFSLQGSNTHQAIDDVAATVSLTRFCYSLAQKVAAEQRTFIVHKGVVPFAEKMRSRYADLYRHTRAQLFEVPTSKESALVDELLYAYNELLRDKLINPIERLDYVVRYITYELLPPSDRHRPLVSQLSDYYSVLETLHEADFCDSETMKEKVYVITVHKAKGLEFDNVIVFDAVAGRYPGAFNKSEKQDAEDARRFYVALSRAKRRILVACCMERTDRYGHPQKCEITPFMSPIMKFFG